MPEGLRESDQLPEAIFTPSTKAQSGHDENISFEQAAVPGGPRSGRAGARVESGAVPVRGRLCPGARHHHRRHQVRVRDLENGKLILIDEILTPDSSRFWPAESYEPGRPQASFDKQYVRDYLEAIKWNKEPPAPELPDEVVEKTREKYWEAVMLPG